MFLAELYAEYIKDALHINFQPNDSIKISVLRDITFILHGNTTEKLL